MVRKRRVSSKTSSAKTRPNRRTVAVAKRRPVRRSTVRVAPRAPRILRPSAPSPARAVASPAPPLPAPRAAQQAGRPVEEAFQIPAGYGDHRIVLMVKDPWWLYAYWELQPHLERQVRNQLGPEEIEGLRSILRVYDVTDRDFPNQPAQAQSDITLSGLAVSWYLHVNAPNRSFLVDIGLLTRHGRFLALARSNRVTTPRFGPSDIIDEEWMVADEDYWKLFGMTAGVGMGSSPTALKEFLARALASPGMFSPGLFSPAKMAAPQEFVAPQ
jgi:hypothetical protein